MTAPERRITARKPERRRDVSGFGIVARPTPERRRPPADSGFADWLADDEPVEVTIDLRSAGADDATTASERVVDVQIVLADEGSL